jgi:hypothetical protein
MAHQFTDANLQRCHERFAELLRAAYDESVPLDRELAKAAAECGAYLLDRIIRPEAHG